MLKQYIAKPLIYNSFRQHNMMYYGPQYAIGIEETFLRNSKTVLQNLKTIFKKSFLDTGSDY